MDAVVLTWRWQNILSVAIMVVGISFVTVAIGQLMMGGKSGMDDG